MEPSFTRDHLLTEKTARGICLHRKPASNREAGTWNLPSQETGLIKESRHVETPITRGPSPTGQAESALASPVRCLPGSAERRPPFCNPTHGPARRPPYRAVRSVARASGPSICLCALRPPGSSTGVEALNSVQYWQR